MGPHPLGPKKSSVWEKWDSLGNGWEGLGGLSRRGVSRGWGGGERVNRLSHDDLKVLSTQSNAKLVTFLDVFSPFDSLTKFARGKVGG